MAFAIKIAGVDRKSSIPLETVSFGETIDNAATMSFTILDKSRAIAVAKRDDVLMTDGSEVLFRGIVMSRAYKPDPAGGRWIAVTCKDYRRELEDRYLGAPDQGEYSGPDESGNFAVKDPASLLSPTDTVAIGEIFDNFVVVAGVTFDTTTDVGAYGGAEVYYGSPISVPAALSDYGRSIGPTLHWWLRPIDDTTINVVWFLFPLDSDGHVPDDDETMTEAPFELAESGADEDTVFDPEDIEVSFSAEAIADAAFVTGRTGSVYTPTGTQTVTVPLPGSDDGAVITIVTDVPVVAGGGTGWVPTEEGLEGQGGHDVSKRQMVVGSDAKSLAERNADGTSALRLGGREAIELTGTVEHDTAIVHAGMKMHVSYPTTLEESIDAWFVVRQVDGRYLNDAGRRRLKLTLGDPPVTQLTKKRPDALPINAAPANVAAPANRLGLKIPLLTILPGTTLNVPAQLENPSLLGVPVKGLTVIWELAYFHFGDTVPVEDPPASWLLSTTELDENGATLNYLSVTTDALGDDYVIPIASIEQP